MKIRKIQISAAEQVENYTVYYIEVFIKEYSWLIRRRYSEFYQLHEKLVRNHNVQPNLLPPKKFFGNLDPDYVEKRREGLEKYLESILTNFEEALPVALQEFLETDKYDVCGVTHALAKELFQTGDAILSKGDVFTLTLLQLHCITARLAVAAPTCDTRIPHGEIGNLYDFLYQLKNLRISGRKKEVDVSENVVLKCDLSIFKGLETLQIYRCDMESVFGMASLQDQLTKITVHHSLHLLKDMLVDDEMWEKGVLESVELNGKTCLSTSSMGTLHSWNAVTEADFSKNELPYIDESVELLPNVEVLNLSHNCIERIEHLQALSNLVELDLSYNNITVVCKNLNAKLGNVKTLKLAGNSIENIDGLEKMYSLVYLDLASNNLTEADQVLSLGELPCLDYLDLRHNPVTKESMYRIRVFIGFDERASQVCLDGHHPSKREMSRIKELLEAEQTFEVINYPEFPLEQTPRKARPGNKKMKNKDRVIALSGDVIDESTTSLSDTDSLVDEGDAHFRTKVEKIRQMGGDAWLTMLGEMQDTDVSSVKESATEDSMLMGVKAEDKCKAALVRPIERDKDKCECTSLTSADSETLVAKASNVHLEEVHGTPPRLLFGFSHQLEELVHEKLKSTKNTISDTFMVEVDGNSADQMEERMVGIDLSKGVIMEIQISTGKTCAKHKLEEISSVDILEVQDVYYIDIRDVYSKEFRRHRSLAAGDDSQGQMKDYKQVARYRMRSSGDAARLFALLYTFITQSCERSTGRVVPKLSLVESRCHTGPFTEQTVEWGNPMGVSKEILHSYFGQFISGDIGRGSENPGPKVRSGSENDGKERVRAKNIQTIYQTLHTEFIEAGALRHDTSDRLGEVVRLVLWAGCLPYTYPEHELAVCLLMTNTNIYLFHLYNQDDPIDVDTLQSVKDLQKVLHCFYSFPVRALNQVVIGLYDQGFRLEVKLDSPKGTFTFLTRDAEKTGKFLEVLCDILGEPLTTGHAPLARRISQLSNSGDKPTFVYPDEERLLALKEQLFKDRNTNCDDQNLLMYSIVRELTDIDDCQGHFHEIEVLTKSLRSLIVTSSRVFLCDEDHVHWPLPTFMRAQPSTPQWVVTKSQEISRIIGVDVFELDTMCDLVGGYGLSLIFDWDNSEVESDRSVTKPNSWRLVFRAMDEREQLQRSLAQVWKDNFQANLLVTHTKTKLRPCGPEDHSTGLLSVKDSVSPSKLLTPAGTPNEKQFHKTHRRGGSDNILPIFKTRIPDSLESLVSLDRKTLNSFFCKAIAERETEEEPESLLHVLWTGCTPYLFPSNEIQVLLLVSNLNIYILADGRHKKLVNKKKGIKLPGGNDGKDSKNRLCFNILPLWRLRQVSVGLFDQTFRLETDRQEDTFTIITRDFNLTSSFLECLNAILASKKHGELTEASRREDEFHKSIYDSQSCHLEDKDDSVKSEFYHADSGVRFIYPSDDTLEILKDAIAKYSQESNDCTSIYDVTILVYLLIFHLPDSREEEPRTLIIMDKALCLCVEDHVNYPLTLFATGLPSNSQYQVQDVRDISALTRVEFSGFNSCDFSLIFKRWNNHAYGSIEEDFDSASMGELCVITHSGAVPGEEEIKWKIFAQTYEEKEKALSLICKLWSDIKGGALPVMKAKEENN